MESAAKRLKAPIWPWVKNPSIPSRGAYHKVEESDLPQHEASNLSQHEAASVPKNPTLAKFTKSCIVFAKVIFWIFYAYSTWWFLTHWGIDYTIFGNENIYHDPPVRWGATRLERAGFHDSRHNERTAFEGAPNPQNDAAWNQILTVGVVGISEQENAKLVNGSAPVLGEPEKYIVELEMFHQLHCLKWVRDQFWELNEAVTANGTIEDFPQRVDHTDHCIDYLRQIIMCHGDITPITLEWIPEIEGYIAHHSTLHTCRSFDVIFEWAEGRNTTGLGADGKHKNVELEIPEDFD